MPRRSAAEARRTREAIVERAVEIASVEGLEGVTIGRLAGELRMSKAGVLNHFGTKEALQLAAVEAARSVFVLEVWERVAHRQPGLDRLLALCDAWFAHVACGRYPGGCFWTATSIEFDSRPGPVRDAVADTLVEFERLLARDLRAAVRTEELPGDTDVAQVVFEIRALGLGLNQQLQMHSDPAAERRARRAVRRAIGRPDLPLGRRPGPRRAAA